MTPIDNSVSSKQAVASPSLVQVGLTCAAPDEKTNRGPCCYKNGLYSNYKKK